MNPKVAIIGDGNVGSALHEGLKAAGLELKITGNNPARVREAGEWAEVIILAVPYSALSEVLKELGGGTEGKVLVDVTNALTQDFRLALGYTTSGAEELQKKVPGAKVVKAFNTLFAGTMRTGKVKGQTLTVFAAGDDAGAREKVLSLAHAIGFDAVDAGVLSNARWLEAMGYFNIQLGFVLKMGPEIGLKLVH